MQECGSIYLITLNVTSVPQVIQFKCICQKESYTVSSNHLLNYIILKCVLWFYYIKYTWNGKHCLYFLHLILSALGVFGWKMLKDLMNSQNSIWPFWFTSKRSNICMKSESYEKIGTHNNDQLNTILHNTSEWNFSYTY